MGHIGIYSYNKTFYTGTNIQPDVLQIFIKSEKNKYCLGYHALPLASLLGFLPVVSLFSGTARVANASKFIFINISKKEASKSELWNAFKNILRGIVEIIPFTGITLIIFDSFRCAIYLNRINNQLKYNERIVGIAIDGKIVFTTDVGKIDTHIKHFADSKLDETRLAVFRHLCLKLLKRVEKEKNSKIGMNELFPKLAKVLI